MSILLTVYILTVLCFWVLLAQELAVEMSIDGTVDLTFWQYVAVASLSFVMAILWPVATPLFLLGLLPIKPFKSLTKD